MQYNTHFLFYVEQHTLLYAKSNCLTCGELKILLSLTLLLAALHEERELMEEKNHNNMLYSNISRAFQFFQYSILFLVQRETRIWSNMVDLFFNLFQFLQVFQSLTNDWGSSNSNLHSLNASFQNYWLIKKLQWYHSPSQKLSFRSCHINMNMSTTQSNTIWYRPSVQRFIAIVSSQ